MTALRIALRTLGLALGCVLAAPAGAATDLLVAWQAAQRHDPVFEAAQAQWQAGLTRQRQGRALLLPQVTASAGGGYVAGDRNTEGAQFNAPGFGASNNAAFRTHINNGSGTNWAVTAQQPLYNAELFANSRQLDRQSQLAEEQFRAAGQELILRTAQAYFAVLLAEESLTTMRAQKEAAARALGMAKERFDSGAAPVTDRDEAQARFDAIAADELRARDELRVRRTALADLTGNAAGPFKRAGADASFERFRTGPLAEWSERAGKRNPLIAMQELGRDIARDEVEKFRALLAPSLDLVARVSDEQMSGNSGFGSTTNLTANSRTVGLQLTIPLYSGGMRDARRDEAVALARKAELDAQALRQEMLRQTEASWLGVNSGIARVNAQAQALRSARSRLDATETGREVGARTMLDLMNAQTDYYQAQRNLAQARYQLLLDRLRLSAAAGDLSDSEVREVNSVLTDGGFAVE